jgi:hypothetical protein
MSPVTQTLSARIDEIEQVLKSLSEEAAQDESARQKLLGVTQKAVSNLESPWEVVSRMYMEVISDHAKLCCNTNTTIFR